MAYEVDAFKADPLVLGWWKKRNLSPLGAAGIALGFPLVVFLIAGAIGMLWHPGGLHGMFEDFRFWVGWRKVAPYPNGPFTLLRDYPALAVICGFSGSLWVIYAQFLAFRTAQGDLFANECFELSQNSTPGTTLDTYLTDQVAELNSRLRWIGRVAASLAVLFLAVGVAMASAQPRYGTFTYYAPHLLKGKVLSRWRDAAYGSWWASFRPFRVTFLFWWFIGSMGLYLVSMQTLVGYQYYRFLRALSGEIELVPNIGNPDEYYGWAQLHRILTTMVFGTVCAAFSGVGTAGLLFPIVGLVPSAIVMIVFVGNIAVFTALAVVELRRKTRRYVGREVRQALAMMPSIDADSDFADLALSGALLDRIDRLHKIPPLPIRYRAVVIGFGAAFVAVVAGVFQILQYFK